MAVEPSNSGGPDGGATPRLPPPAGPRRWFSLLQRVRRYERTVPIWSRVLRDCRDTLSGCKRPRVRIAGIVADALEQVSWRRSIREILTYRVKMKAGTWLRSENATLSAAYFSQVRSRSCDRRDVAGRRRGDARSDRCGPLKCSDRAWKRLAGNAEPVGSGAGLRFAQRRVGSASLRIFAGRRMPRRTT